MSTNAWGTAGRLAALIAVLGTMAGLPAAARAAAGAPDPGFGDGGQRVTVAVNNGGDEAALRAIRLLPDGKLIGVGFSEGGTPLARRAVLVRYTPAGGFDPSFDGDGNTDGFIQTPLAGASSVEATDLLVLPSGKLLVAGHAVIPGGSPAEVFRVTRHNPDGSVDTTFGGGDGHVDVAFDRSSVIVGGNARAAAIVRRPDDGRVVVAGTVRDGSDEQFAAAALTAEGAPDTSFAPSNGQGMLVFDMGDDERLTSLALQPDGKAILAGSARGSDGSRHFALARRRNDGTADPTFGDAGKRLLALGTGGDAEAGAVALQPDGRLVAAGYALQAGARRFALARLGLTGQPDSGFGSGGTVLTPVGEEDAEAHAIVLLPSGRIAVAGEAVGNSRTTFALARYTSAGAPDATFNGDGDADGRVLHPSPSPADAPRPLEAFGLTLQSDGKLVAAGSGFGGASSSIDKIAIARYLGDPPPSSTTPAPAPGGSPRTESPAVPVTRLLILSRSLRMDRRGRVRLRLGCPEVARRPCAGRVVLRSARRLRLKPGRSRRRTVRLARKRFSVAPGARRTVRVRLSRRNRLLVQRLRRLRVRVVASPASRSGALLPARRTVSLRATRR